MAETDSAKLIGAKSECLLVLSKSDLYLASASTKKVLGVWPYDSLRRYYCIEGMFGFVAGRRSPRGEGEFKFVTSQKEDIYHRLERAILRAKRGSQGSTSSSEEATKGGVDSRPPAPLPNSQQLPPRQETPVQTSESDEDIFRNSPTFSPPTLKGIIADPPASDISPAYGQFGSNSSGQRVGGGAARYHSSPWLHESVSVVPQPQESGKKPSQEQPQVPKRPPLPSSRGSQISMGIPVASEEDTYSHTVHSIPEQFQNKNIEHNVVGGSMYNALVHQRSQTVHRQSSRPTSDADTNLYNVAFPEGRKVISSGDYAIARHPDMPQYTPGGVPYLPPRRVASVTKVPLRRDMIDGPEAEAREPQPQQQSQEAKKPLPPPPSGAEEAQKNGDDEGMTTNPMYGSQDHLLTEMAILNMNEQLRDLDLHMDSSVPEGYSGRVVHTSTGAAGVVVEGLEMDDEGDQEFTSNPIYGELEEEQKRRIVEEEKRTKLNMSSCTEEADTGEGERHGQTKDGACQKDIEDRSLLSESDQGMVQSRQEREPSQLSTTSTSSSTTTAASEQSAAAASESGVQRDAKGYSKVDKSKKVGSGSTSGGEAAGSSASESREGSVEVHLPSMAVPVPPGPMLESQISDETNSGTPPPLPERNYSFDESELNQPPVINGGNET